MAPSPNGGQIWIYDRDTDDDLMIRRVGDAVRVRHQRLPVTRRWIATATACRTCRSISAARIRRRPPPTRATSRKARRTRSSRRGSPRSIRTRRRRSWSIASSARTARPSSITRTLPAKSRTTLDLIGVHGGAGERFLDGRGIGSAGGRRSHDDLGSPRAYGSHAETSIAAPSTTWHLAEGATHGAFDLFYLLQNPGDTADDGADHLPAARAERRRSSSRTTSRRTAA